VSFPSVCVKTRLIDFPKKRGQVKQNNYNLSANFYEISPKKTQEKLDESCNFSPDICNKNVSRIEIIQDRYLSMRQRWNH